MGTIHTRQLHACAGSPTTKTLGPVFERPPAAQHLQLNGTDTWGRTDTLSRGSNARQYTTSLAAVHHTRTNRAMTARHIQRLTQGHTSWGRHSHAGRRCSLCCRSPHGKKPHSIAQTLSRRTPAAAPCVKARAAGAQPPQENPGKTLFQRGVSR